MPTDITKYIPEEFQGKELYLKLQEMLEFVINQSEDDFKDTIEKYREVSQLSEEAALATIGESGLSYISDLLNIIPTIKGFGVSIIPSTPQELLPYIYFINSFKGTKIGVETTLRLLKITGFELIEHWEFTKNVIKADGKVLEKFEVKLEVPTENSAIIRAVLPQLTNFFRNYVYPIIILSATKSGELNSQIQVAISPENIITGSVMVVI